MNFGHVLILAGLIASGYLGYAGFSIYLLIVVTFFSVFGYWVAHGKILALTEGNPSGYLLRTWIFNGVINSAIFGLGVWL